MFVDVPARLVTVKTFGQMVDAHIARATLAAHGVDSFVADEHLLSMNPHYIVASGIRLQVRDTDASLASEILNRPPEEDDDEADEDNADDGPHCPHCNARYAYYEWPSGAVLLGVLLLGIPFLFLKKQWHCRKCNHQWHAEAPAGRAHSPYRRPRRSALARPGTR